MEVAWVEACKGGPEVGGGEERAALVLGLVGGEWWQHLQQRLLPPRRSWGEAAGAGVTPRAGVLLSVVKFIGVAFGAAVPEDCFFELRLL